MRRLIAFCTLALALVLTAICDGGRAIINLTLATG
jgi:hypothetical protein